MACDPYSDMTPDLSCHRLAAWAYMCAHADDGSVIRPFVPTLVPSLHDSRRVNRRRTAALQPRAADRAHPAHRTRDRPFYADDSIVERLQASWARAGASQRLPLRKTTHQRARCAQHMLHNMVDHALYKMGERALCHKPTAVLYEALER